MNHDKYVYAQITVFFDWCKFNRIVAKYGGDRYVKTLHLLESASGDGIRSVDKQ